MRDQADAGKRSSTGCAAAAPCRRNGARPRRTTNPPVRLRSARSISPFDDGWDTLAAEFGELPKLATTLTRDATEVGDQLEQLARYRLRPGGQSVSGLRARLHLLLCAADACLSRLFARPRLRDQADLQAGGRRAAGEGAAQAGLHGAHAGARLEHRSVPAGGAHAEADACRCCRCWIASTIRSASSPSRPACCAISTS